MLCLRLQDGKTIDLSEIIDVHLEFDDPTLVLVRKLDITIMLLRSARVIFLSQMQGVIWQGGRSTLLNFQFTDNRNNIVYRLSADEPKSTDRKDRASESGSDKASEQNQTRIPQRQSNTETRLVGSVCAYAQLHRVQTG